MKGILQNAHQALCPYPFCYITYLLACWESDPGGGGGGASPMKPSTLLFILQQDTQSKHSQSSRAYQSRDTRHSLFQLTLTILVHLLLDRLFVVLPVLLLFEIHALSIPANLLDVSLWRGLATRLL